MNLVPKLWKWKVQRTALTIVMNSLFVAFCSLEKKLPGKVDKTLMVSIRKKDLSAVEALTLRCKTYKIAWIY